MNTITARRLAGALLATAVATGVATTPATAAPRCKPPAERWHSCLSTAHQRLAGDEVRLKRANAQLVVRYADCPTRGLRRTVVIRDDEGARLLRERVKGTCRNGLGRWKLAVRNLDIVLPRGTVVRSFWSGVADADDAPKVKLN